MTVIHLTEGTKTTCIIWFKALLLELVGSHRGPYNVMPHAYLPHIVLLMSIAVGKGLYLRELHSASGEVGALLGTLSFILA